MVDPAREPVVSGLRTDRPLVLGILNVTPDSFSDGGDHLDVEAAVARAEEMLAEGADIIDVGGESTRPGAEPVPVGVEIDRVLPVIDRLRGRAIVSIDTRHGEVARAAVAAGATIVNDISASLAAVAAETGAVWIAMHMRGDPRTMQHDPRYDDVVAEVAEHLRRRVAEADALGVPEVWTDPGFGFGKTLDHNLALLAGLDEIVQIGRRVVVGTSRKKVTGVLVASRGDDEIPPTSDRLEGSVATALLAVRAGAGAVRVHDVAATVAAIEHWRAHWSTTVTSAAPSGDDGAADPSVGFPGDPGIL